MHTVGQLLKNARIAKGFTFEEVEHRTKIRIKFLSALENDDYRNLPSEAYARGFVKNYSQFLRLDTTKTLPLFRRQFQEHEQQSVVPPVDTYLKAAWFRMTPAVALRIFIGILGILLAIYIFWQYRLLHAPPRIVLEEPKEGFVVTGESSVSVFGYTDSDATVSINGNPITVKDGKFFEDLAFSPGQHLIIITATNRFGKKSTLERKVIVE